MIEVREIAHGSPEYVGEVALRRRVLRHPLGLDFTDEELAAEVTDFHLVAVLDSEVVGCLVLTPKGESVKMRQVAVSETLQRSGVGRRMVTLSEELGRREGFAEMVLNARATAVPFYLSLGYELVGDEFVEVGIPHRKMRKPLE